MLLQGSLGVNISEIMVRVPATIRMDDDVKKVQDLFEEHGFHHLLVVEKGRLLGVVSDRDLLRNLSPFIGKLAEKPRDLATLNRRVHQIMTRKPVTVSPEVSVEAAAHVMLERHVSCLPVITENGNLVGIVSSRDLLSSMRDPSSD